MLMLCILRLSSLAKAKTRKTKTKKKLSSTNALFPWQKKREKSMIFLMESLSLSIYLSIYLLCLTFASSDTLIIHPLLSMWS